MQLLSQNIFAFTDFWCWMPIYLPTCIVVHTPIKLPEEHPIILKVLYVNYGIICGHQWKSWSYSGFFYSQTIKNSENTSEIYSIHILINGPWSFCQSDLFILEYGFVPYICLCTTHPVDTVAPAIITPSTLMSQNKRRRKTGL